MLDGIGHQVIRTAVSSVTPAPVIRASVLPGIRPGPRQASAQQTEQVSPLWRRLHFAARPDTAMASEQASDAAPPRQVHRSAHCRRLSGSPPPDPGAFGAGRGDDGNGAVAGGQPKRQEKTAATGCCARCELRFMTAKSGCLMPVAHFTPLQNIPSSQWRSRRAAC